MADSRAGTGKKQDEPEALYQKARKGSKKKKKNRRMQTYPRGIGANLKELTMAKAGTILATK